MRLSSVAFSRRPSVCLLSGMLVLAASARGEEGNAPAAQQAPLAGIAFVAGPVVDYEDDGHMGAYHWRDGYVYPKGATFNSWERTHSAPRPGRNLFALVPARPDGKLTQLTFLTNGSVYDPEPSYDGQKLLFAMRPDGDDWYHLFEVNIDGTGLKQLTSGPFNDVSGVYLPDGRIVFCSDRTGVLDEYHEERSEFLYRMNGDGTGIEQISFVPGTYFEPTVLANGTILCSFWDAFHISVPPFIKHETYLITLRPDGTEERHLFGAGEYRFFNRTRHSAIGLTRAGELPDGRILVQSELGPSLYDANLGTELGKVLTPVFPGTVSAQTGGTTHAVHLSPLGTRTSPYPLPDGRFLLAATLPGSRDLAIYVAHPDSREMHLVYDLPNQSEWDPVPIGVARERPRRLPDKQRDTGSKQATFVVAAGRHADTPERNALLERARFARVLAAEYTTVTTSSHTSLETRILGTVPIQPDGSIAFEAPAETPLFLDLLDARGNRLVLQAGYMAARAGEIKSCAGCHAPQFEAAPQGTVQALAHELPRISRDSTDLSYRRNDPDEYRRQALILEAPTYRAWLASATPELRRRGLEMLAYLPDEVTPHDRQSMAALLRDNAAEVRRQAALALAMTGTLEQAGVLVQALGDGDWQTKFYAAMALEAMTGENLDLRADLELSAQRWPAYWRFLEQKPARAIARIAGKNPANLADDFERDAWLEAVGRMRWLAEPESVAAYQTHRAKAQEFARDLLRRPWPPAAAIRAAGMLADASAVPLLERFLVRGGFTQSDEAVPDSADALAREAQGTAWAKEAAMALGRIGTPDAVERLWRVVAQTVPNQAPIAVRHYQSGPRPEEYTYLRALIYSNAQPSLAHVPYLIALLPYTEGEKPRFEDRAKTESQRARLPRILLERAGLRKPAVALAAAVLAGQETADAPLYRALVDGTNIDRPRSEHGRQFNKVERLQKENALHLLACLAHSAEEIPEETVAQCLVSGNHRERIDAAVILRKFGFSARTEAILREEAARPYPFREIWSIGKGRPDTQFRDKAYMMMALAAHARDLAALEGFTDFTRSFRDIRIGLALGLGFRGTPDGAPLLQRLASDPLFAVHRECENAAVEIAGRALERHGEQPQIVLPARHPLHEVYLPRGQFAFAEPVAGPAAVPGTIALDLKSSDVLLKALAAAVDGTQYKNVSSGFARNAERMRLFDAGELAKVLQPQVARGAPSSAELDKALAAAVESPYPFANYLAARLIALRNDAHLAERLIMRLAGYVGEANTVGFYWAADTLGQLRASAAVPELARFVEPKAYDRTFGPPGLAYGYAAARAIARIQADSQAPEVRALLTHDNVWLHAGALEGLAEAGAHVADAVALTAGGREPSAILEHAARAALFAPRREGKAR